MVHVIQLIFENSLQLLWAWKSTFLVVAVILLFEFLFPARKFSLRENINRIFLGMFYLTLTIIVVGPIITILNTKISQSIPPVTQLKLSLENTEWRIITLIFGTAIWWLWWDFFQYWAHRLVHTKWLFSIHRHHHDVEIDAFASFRHAPAEMLYLHTLITIPTSIYFAVALPDVGAQWQHFLISFIVLIEHSNIRFGWPISYIFITPQMHRIHHSTKPHHWNKNFSQYFTFWDYVFGTLYIPKKDEYPHTGEVISFDTMFTNYFPPFQKKRSLLLDHEKLDLPNV